VGRKTARRRDGKDEALRSLAVCTSGSPIPQGGSTSALVAYSLVEALVDVFR
jgi:hypothetical protein